MKSRKVKEPSPVSDSFLGRLYRASPEGLAVLVKTVPPQTRAALAVYCLHREPLSSLGLAIAASCERRDLLSQGGSAVLDIIQKLKAPKRRSATIANSPPPKFPSGPRGNRLKWRSQPTFRASENNRAE
jgi:hypothetical protein